MMRKLVIGVLFPVVLFLLPLNMSYADTAEVLPKGITRLGLNSYFYFPMDERYDPDGHTEDIDTDFNARMDRQVFPDLGELEDLFEFLFPGSLPGGASVGDSVVSFEYKAYEIEFAAHYGITDRMTFGIKIPFRKIRNQVDAKIDTTNATLGINPQYGQPGDPFGVPLIPVSLGGVKDDALASELVQSSLQDLGYKRVEKWDESGILDIEAVLKYQYLKTDNWRLAFTGGVRFPTGDEDDPDNLVDYPFGDNVYALLFRFQNDYIGIKNLVLNTTFKYDLVLPDEETKRVLYDVNIPITRFKEKVDRDLGDIFEFECSGTYQLPKGFSFSLLYRYGCKSEDDIDGDLGYAYKSLEEETDWTSHIFIAGLSYSTIPMFRAKRFPVPLTASISYRNRFAGTNNVFKSEYIGLNFAVFF